MVARIRSHLVNLYSMTTHLYLRYARAVDDCVCGTSASSVNRIASVRVYCIYTAHTLATLGARLHYSSIPIEYTHILTPFFSHSFSRALSCFCNFALLLHRQLPLRISRTFKLSFRIAVHVLFHHPTFHSSLRLFVNVFEWFGLVWFLFGLDWIGLD